MTDGAPTWSTSLLTARGAGYLSSSKCFLVQSFKQLEKNEYEKTYFMAVIIGGGPIQMFVRCQTFAVSVRTTEKDLDIVMSGGKVRCDLFL